MLLTKFKRAINQCGLSVLNFVKDLYINLPAVNFSWSDVPLLSVLAKIFSRNVVAVVNLESSGVVVYCGCVSCLSIKQDAQVKMIIVSLNGVEKKSRDISLMCPSRFKTPW